MRAMRLPCDSTLLVIDVQEAIDDASWGPRNNDGAEEVIAALLAAWRAEALPIVHVRHDLLDPRSPYRPGAPGHRFKALAQPLAEERIIAKHANSAFIGTRLEEALDEIGATTLVICGALTHNSVEATVRHGGNLGYRVFVVADACWAADKRDLSGRLWPAEDVHALSLAHMHGEYAQVVDSATTLRAAALANARRRRVR
ncbi:MAG TPA: cysteine hydrolase family protein [Roseiarcus sp.]|nr:cysteine hydrolase family protein [Roseiarcus sp.]